MAQGRIRDRVLKRMPPGIERSGYHMFRFEVLFVHGGVTNLETFLDRISKCSRAPLLK